MTGGSSGGARVGLLVTLAFLALFLLHNDLWWWHDATLVWGLPIGLAYHFGFCLVTAGVMAVAARRLTDRDRS